jgi:hypothetical protein
MGLFSETARGPPSALPDRRQPVVIRQPPEIQVLGLLQLRSRLKEPDREWLANAARALKKRR